MSTTEVFEDDGTTVIQIPASLSPSRAGDFQTCPLLFRFRSIDRLPSVPSPAAVRGTLVHGVLESLFDLPATQRTADTAVELLAPTWTALVAAEPEVEVVTEGGSLDDWLDAAAPLVRSYFALEDPRALEPADRELLVEASVGQGELVVRGYVDRFDVAPDGRTRVVDYKTGRAPSEAFEAKALFQMRFYALALWRSTGVLPQQLKLLYLGDRQSLIDQPDEQSLLATERKVLALWAAIGKAIENRDFRPSPGRLCDWCDHQELCPAFGGTPPELPVLQIVPFRPASVREASSDAAVDDIVPTLADLA
jgi:putative RecB family exonuclease